MRKLFSQCLNAIMCILYLLPHDVFQSILVNLMQDDPFNGINQLARCCKRLSGFCRRELLWKVVWKLNINSIMIPTEKHWFNCYVCIIKLISGTCNDFINNYCLVRFEFLNKEALLNKARTMFLMYVNTIDKHFNYEDLSDFADNLANLILGIKFNHQKLKYNKFISERNSIHETISLKLAGMGFKDKYY